MPAGDFTSNAQLSKEEAWLFKTIFDQAGFGAAVTDLSGNIKYINEYFAALHGYKPAELLDKNLSALQADNQLQDLLNMEVQLKENGRYRSVKMWHRHASGYVFPVIVDGTLLKDGRGAPKYIAVTAFIPARLKHTGENLQQSEQFFSGIVDSLPEAAFVIDRQGRVIAWNRAMEKMTSVPKSIMLGRDNYEYALPFYGKRRPMLIDLILLPEGVLERFKNNYIYLHREGDTITAEIRLPATPGGENAFLVGSASILRNASGSIAGAVEIVRDITGRMQAEEDLRKSDRKRYEEQLKYLSLHDHLTGLYNRTFFEEELRRLSVSREHPITIISIDIDGLKLFNDSLGHERGDELLKSCARVLKQSLRKSDILARIGGDEFAAILPRTNEKTGLEIAERIRSNTCLYNSGQTGLHLSLSIGVATAETADVPLEEAFKRSDRLMYREKLRHSSSTRSQMIKTLMAALAEKDFITEGHVQRLTRLCLVLGEKLGLSMRQLNDLTLLAQVHDLGKLAIPDHILFKNGPLSDEEWNIMRLHPEKGFRIASSSSDLSGVAGLILKHHERWDGKGYPLGLMGEEIPIECRVLAIADAFDAMTNDRPYSKAKSHEEALTELKRCAGTQFDPDLVEAFLSVYEKVYAN
ncbi:hypothetical protein PTH_1663 [Pelotomaculum thermopropionicum SI]|uniref:Uncharacterized protein n=1 Tax=Pelotomaculum thermopropionicum (strain DSM 13744 / JCM 10971 / SI) TaxID=370438 RepID=A5D1P2_PELTS|nr:hypothetical protein PTH_1663 [Pelotomaculum thermopropionicum SI]